MPQLAANLSRSPLGYTTDFCFAQWNVFGIMQTWETGIKDSSNSRNMMKHVETKKSECVRMLKSNSFQAQAPAGAADTHHPPGSLDRIQETFEICAFQQVSTAFLSMLS